MKNAVWLKNSGTSTKIPLTLNQSQKKLGRSGAIISVNYDSLAGKLKNANIL